MAYNRKQRLNDKAFLQAERWFYGFTDLNKVKDIDFTRDAWVKNSIDGLYLLNHLRENRFPQASDADFIRERADHAAEVYE